MWIVGKAEPLFRNAYEVSIQLVIAILIVNSRDAIIAGRQVFPHCSALALASRDGRRAMTKRLVQVFRPALRRGEQHSADVAS